MDQEEAWCRRLCARGGTGLAVLNARSLRRQLGAALRGLGNTRTVGSGAWWGSGCGAPSGQAVAAVGVPGLCWAVAAWLGDARAVLGEPYGRNDASSSLAE